VKSKGDGTDFDPIARVKLGWLFDPDRVSEGAVGASEIDQPELGFILGVDQSMTTGHLVGGENDRVLGATTDGAGSGER
jgi:hypothetical protein